MILQCSVKDCMNEKNDGDTLFCIPCRDRWRETVRLNNYNETIPDKIILGTLKAFQELNRNFGS